LRPQVQQKLYSEMKFLIQNCLWLLSIMLVFWTNQAMARPATMSIEECLKLGGTIVGDIGNGAIHRPGYKCESNGELPLGTVIPEPHQPIPTEGQVCCGPPKENSNA
jgi:hypothetical protein